MPINFIPNDPGALSAMPMRKQTPRKMPGSRRASLSLPSPAPAEKPADPGTPAFLFWQCRESVLAALEMWAKVEGPLTKWARSRVPRTLKLAIDAGEDLNAYYDGEALKFFHFQVGAATMFSGASTEAAAHECGHGLLDAIRPDLWDVNYTEAGAFHEAFADCVALLTQLDDKATRIKVVAVTNGNLSKPSFFETLAEDLSAAVRKSYGASHPASEPRHAFNKFKWALPENLPESGPPKVLSGEVHSFARVFVGCFYDLLTLVFAAQSSASEANLLRAADISAKLLIAGTKNAPVDPRFFRAVGRAMLLADDAQNGGKFKPLIQKAFSQHGIALGAPGAVVAAASLAGPAPSRKGKSLVVAANTLKDVRSRIDASPGRALTARQITLGEGHVSELVYPHRVKLDSLGTAMRGVVAVGHVSTLVGENQGQAALVGNPLPKSVADAEVLTFVSALMKFNRVDTGKLSAEKAKRSVAGKPGRKAKKGARLPTHRIVTRGGTRILERVRFACGCNGPCR